MNWWKCSKSKVRLNQPLKKYTTFKIGGRAKFFIEPEDIAGLKSLLSLLKRYKITYAVIGGGSNLLVDDRGFAGAVIRLNSLAFKKIIFKDNLLKAGSGCRLNQVILSSQKRGLSGLEFLSGLPGSVGGALAMNAGGGRQAKRIGDLVSSVTVIDRGLRIRKLGRKQLKFGYRRSNLAEYIILSADFSLAKQDKQEIKNRISQYLTYRRMTQDLSRPSAGCIFKNPTGDSAARLIDACGLKGKRIGGAVISKRHANFILNNKNARSSDVLKLISLIRKKVSDRFRVGLETEIKIWKAKIK